MNVNEEWYRFEAKQQVHNRRRQAAADRRLKDIRGGQSRLAAAAGTAVAIGMGLLAAIWLFTAATFAGVGFHSFAHQEITDEH